MRLRRGAQLHREHTPQNYRLGVLLVPAAKVSSLKASRIKAEMGLQEVEFITVTIWVV